MALDISNYNPRFQSSYNAVSSIANGQPVAQSQVQPQQQYNEPMRQMTDGERLFASLANIGNSLSESTGFSRYYQDNGGLASLASPEGFTRFAMNLPAGMASALPTGVANLYAAGTGSDVVYGSDLANNMIREEKLDAGQRVASAVTGGIDTLGLAVGGSGSLLNEIGRAWKAGRGLEAAAKTGAGARALSLTGSRLANSGVMTPGRAFAFDVAEEAGEEAVQSVSEDVIQKQLDEGSIGRAFEGAFMGAMGGGMMSGGAFALRSATNSDIEKARAKAPDKIETNAYDAFNNLVMSNMAEGTIFTPEDARSLMEQRRMEQWTKPVAGSIMATFVNSETITTIDDIIPGIEELRSIWKQSVDAETQLLAFFNGGYHNLKDNEGIFIKRNDLADVLFSDDEQAACKLLNNLLDARYGKNGTRKVVFLRNPATTEGSVYLNVKAIGTGRGIDMSGNTAMLVGGDFDGDRGALFFDAKRAGFDPQVWASDVIARNEHITAKGKAPSMINWVYGSLEYTPDSQTIEDIDSSLYNKLMRVFSILGNDEEFNKQQARACKNILMEAFKRRTDPDTGKALSEGERNAILTDAVIKVRNNVALAYSEKYPDADERSVAGYTRKVINEAISAFAESRISAQQFASQVSSHVFNNLTKLVESESGSQFGVTPGSTGAFGTAASGYQSGFPGWFTAKDYDQFYRNYAAQVYTFVKEHESDVLGALGEKDIMSAYGRLVQYGCHVLTQGTTPVKAISGMIDQMVMLRFRETWNADEEGQAHFVPGERSNMIECYVNAYNDFVDMYNKSVKVLVDGRMTESYLAPKREKINLDEESKTNRFGSEFVRMFGLEPITRFIPPEVLPDGIDPRMTLADAVIVAAKKNLLITTDSVSGDMDSSGKFFGMLVSARKAEGRKVQNIAISGYMQFRDSLKGIRDRIVNGKVDPRDIESLRAFTNWVYSALNVNAAVAAQFLDPERWAGTVIGEMMLSGDPQQFLNACTIINFGGKFFEAMEYRASNGNDPFTTEICDRLMELRAIDSIHANIVDAFLEQDEDGNYKSVPGVLEILLDGNISFEAKQKNLEKFLSGVDQSVAGSLYLSGLSGAVSDTSAASDVSLTTKLRKGQSYISQYKKTLYDSNIAEVGTIKSIFTDRSQCGDVKFSDVMRHVLHKNIFRISMKPLSILMADIANVSNHQAEKGTANDLAGSFYVMMDVASNGKQTSFDADTFSSPFGNYMLVDLAQNPDLLLKILADGNFSINVFDDDGNLCVFNRDSLLSEVSPSYRASSTKEITDTVWFDLLETVPSLVSYLGGVEMSFASGDGGVKSSLSRSRTFLDYCNDFIRDEHFAGHREAATKDFYEAADELAVILMKDLRTYKYLFASLSPEQKFKAMRGYEPSYRELWGNAQSLARCILAMKMHDIGGIGAAAIDFSTKLRGSLSDSLKSNIADMYGSIIFDMQNGISRNVDQIKSVLIDAANDAMFLQILNSPGGFVYTDENGIERTISSGNIEDAALKLQDIVGRGVEEVNDAVTESIGLFLAVESVLGTFDNEQQFIDYAARRLTNVGAVQSRLSAESAAKAIWNKIMENGGLSSISTAAIGDELGNILISKESPIFSGQIDEIGFLEKLKSLGSFIHDDRFIKYADAEIAKLNGGSEDESYSFDQAEDLHSLYKDLFDSKTHQINAPLDPRTRFIAQEKLIVRYTNYVLAYSMQKHFLTGGKKNPHELGDRYDMISLIDEFMQDDEVNDLFMRYDKIDPTLRVDHFIDDFKLPQITTQEESAYMNQFMEAVSAGRVISTVGINGSEVMKTAALAFVPVGKPMPFKYDFNPVSAVDLARMFNNRDLDPRAHILMPDGTIAVYEDVMGQLEEGETYQLFDPKINPHGIFYGPQPEPNVNDYGVKYQSTLGILNRLHMAAMEDLVLKVRKAFGENASDYIRNRFNPRVTNVDFTSQENFLADARTSYQEFCYSAAEQVLSDYEYKEDLEKLHIGVEEIMSIVQMMTVGYKVTYTETVVENGKKVTKTKQAVIDVMHLYDNTLDSRLEEILKNGGEFSSAELFVVPLQAISNRVAKAVFNNSRDKTSKKDAADAAYLAMTNWDDYQFGALSSKDVAKTFSPLGRSHSFITAERSGTPVQNIFEQIHGYDRRSQTFFENPWNKAAVTYRDIDSESMRDFRAKNRKILSYSKDFGEIVISNVFGLSENDTSNFGHDTGRGRNTFGYAHGILSSMHHGDRGHVTRYSGAKECVLCFNANPQSDEFREAVMYASYTGAQLLIPMHKSPQVHAASGMLEQSDIKINLTGREDGPTCQMVKLNIAPGASDPLVLFEDMAARRRDINTKDRNIVLMLDEIGRYVALGDSSMLARRSMVERFVSRMPAKTHTVDLRSLVDQGDDTIRFEKLTKEDFEALKSLDPAKAEQWDSFESAMKKIADPSYGLGFLENGERYIRQSISDFVSAVDQSGETTDSISLYGFRGGDCVGIVKAVSPASNKIQYIPIMAPASMGTVVSGSVARPDGSARAVLYYNEQVDFSQPNKRVTFKMSGSSRAADKGFAYVKDDSIFPVGVDAIENYATVSGRMKGRDEVILYTNLSNYMNMNYLNMMFTMREKDDGVQLDFSDEFKMFFAKRGEACLDATRAGRVGEYRSSDGSDKSLWDLLLEDDTDAWACLGIDEVSVVDKTAVRQNIKRVIRSAERYDIPVCQLFGISSFTVDWKESTRDTASSNAGFEPTIREIYTVQNVPDVDLVFSGWAWNDICDFYAVIGKNYNLMAPRNGDIGEHHSIFDRDGRMYINDDIGYSRVIIDDFAYLGHESESETPGNAASISLQQRINKLMMYGYDTTTLEFVEALAGVIANDASVYRSYDAYHFTELAKRDSVSMGGPLFQNYAEYEKDSELEDLIKTDTWWHKTIVDSSGKEIGNLSDSKEGREILKAIENLKTELGIRGNLPLSFVHRIVNHVDGSTAGDFENNTIYASTFIKHINTAAKNVKESGLLVVAGKYGTRYSVPSFDPSFIRYLCSISNLKYDEYVKAMWVEEQKALENITKIPDANSNQRIVLLNYLAAMRKSWRDNDTHPWRAVGFVFGGLTVQEMTKNDSILTKVADRLGFDTGAFSELSKLGTKLMQNQVALMSKKRSQESIKSDVSYSGLLHRDTINVEGFVSRGMDNVVTFSRAMAVLNLGVVFGNPAGRVASQSFMDVLLNIGADMNIGPFAGKSNLSQATLNVALGDQNMFDAYMAIREMGVIGDESLVVSSTNIADLVRNLSEVRSGRSTFNKVATRLFTFANGGNFAMKQQIGLFWKRLIHFIEEEPALSAYLEKDANGVMAIEKAIQGETPASFFLSCFVQDPQNGRPELYACAMKAMNSAMTGDMAQRHWLASFLHHALKDRPLGRFLFSTTICKFPRYQFNLVDKALNWFAPMSTLNYILTHAAMEWDERQAQKAEAEGREYTRFDFQLDQRFVNAREAMMYDCAHIGPMAVAAVLLSVGNAIEPPDDEKKWGDPDEWLICGYRVGESWWIGDMLGAFLPSILFTQSCILGKPNSSLLVNGSMAACYGNPFLRAADVCDVLVNWDSDDNLNSYVSAVEQYQDAEGGAPGFLDWINANAVSTAANLITNTVTPSIVREWYRNSQEYEKSYKKIYKKTPTGKLSEAGEKGQTQNTTYFDAQMRRACRNNPFLAVVMDMLHSGDGTGYLLSEMPDTLYFDETQTDSAKYWSIDGLSEQQAEEKLSLILYKLRNEDIDDLQRSGFYLDKNTLYALGSYMWDSYYAYEDEWNKLGEVGALSYTVLGNGNYDMGKQRYYQLLNQKNAYKDEIKRLYNEKIKGSYLAQGPQQYHRYTTSYRTDSEGNIYATGYHRQGMLPFVSAPGTVDNPEGTAGYENDFMSISAVTGQPMDQRALVPVPNEYIDLPSFAGFSAKGDGEGYSGKWSRYATTTPKNSDGQPEGLTYPDGTPIPDAATINAASGTPRYSGGSGGGGGGGGSRRSSGSPSTYVPGISSRNYAPNTPNAATARASRAYDAQFDYLRPNVETKGSRDAYKRGDM